jgi:hypothetical protein
MDVLGWLLGARVPARETCSMKGATPSAGRHADLSSEGGLARLFWAGAPTRKTVKTGAKGLARNPTPTRHPPRLLTTGER